jgi:hypothetical protein
MSGMCKGEVQFASVENSPGAGENDDLPIVVGVGINYGQQKNDSTDFLPHLRDKNGLAEVEDKPGSAMRKMMDLTFNEYDAHRKPWHDRKVAASQNLILPKKIQNQRHTNIFWLQPISALF